MIGIFSNVDNISTGKSSGLCYCSAPWLQGATLGGCSSPTSFGFLLWSSASSWWNSWPVSVGAADNRGGLRGSCSPDRPWAGPEMSRKRQPLCNVTRDEGKSREQLRYWKQRWYYTPRRPLSLHIAANTDDSISMLQTPASLALLR